jgi:predicted HTH transcriptional regulator
MEPVDLLGILARGEDSGHQFKRNVNNVEAMAYELVALSNCEGGEIIIGVDDDGTYAGNDDHCFFSRHYAVFQGIQLSRPEKEMRGNVH